MELGPALAGLAVAVMCGVLSPLVVVRRLAFIGQGVSHAAFGGIGLAVVLGLSATDDALATFLVVAAFCVASALLIGVLTRRLRAMRPNAAASEDTVIGIVLVATMALGALLLTMAPDQVDGGADSHAGHVHAEGDDHSGHDHSEHADHVHTPEIEAILFGSLSRVTMVDAGIAWGAALGTLGIMWLMRRQLVFWSFDELGALTFGVDVSRVRLVMLAILGVVVVVTMKLSGVILATALLVLPGAVAMRINRGLAGVLAISVATAIGATAFGIATYPMTGTAPGPLIALALVVFWVLACAVERVSGPGPASGG